MAVDTLTPRLVTAIGRESGSEAEILARVFSGFRSREGLVLANGAPPEIRVYSDSGALIRRIGRAGGGPGEFRGLTWIAAMRGDSVAALDAMGSRVTIFGPTGEYVRAVSIEVPEYGGAEWLGVTDHGFAVGVAKRADPRRLPVGGTARDSFAVLFLSPPGALLGTSPAVGGRWWRREATDDGVQIRSIEWRTRALVAGAEGNVVLSSSDSPDVLRWRAGAWDTIRIDSVREARRDSPAPALREHVALGPSAELWVADTLAAPDGLRLWRVFDSVARLRYVVRLPAPLSVWQVGDGWLLARSLTSGDVEQAQLWTLGPRP